MTSRKSEIVQLKSVLRPPPSLAVRVSNTDVRYNIEIFE